MANWQSIGYLMQMNYFIILILTLTSFKSFALSTSELKVGDILLQPLHCWACNLIEAETGSEYSHIGVIIHEDEQLYVAEAFGSVKKVSLTEFLNKTQKHKQVEVLRPEYVNPNLHKIYLENFDGLPYDSKFLWDDNEIYCSELLQKLFYKSNMLTPTTKPMTFNVYRDYWERYFRGDIPDSLPGISPVAFKESGLYLELGFISEF